MDALSPVLSSIRLLPAARLKGYFYASLVVALALMAVVGKGSYQATFLVSLRSSNLTWLTDVLDPLLIQALSLMGVAWVMWRYLSVEHSKEPLLVKLWVCLFLPVLLLAVSYLFEQTLFKPSFKYYRPTTVPLGDPWLSEMTSHILETVAKTRGITPTPYQDVPSGFVLRQVLLFYLATFFFLQPNFPALPRLSVRYTRAFLWAANILFLFWVAFSRVYRANHTIFAEVVGFGLGTFLFWLVISVLYLFSPYRGAEHRDVIGELLCISVAFVLLFIYFANDAQRWLYFFFGILIILAVASVIPPSFFTIWEKDHH